MELTVLVKERSGGRASDPVVVRSVDDLDKCARSLAGVIKTWLRAVPLAHGSARKVFDITATWDVKVQKLYPQDQVDLTVNKRGRVTRIKRAVHRVARHKKVKNHAG